LRENEKELIEQLSQFKTLPLKKLSKLTIPVNDLAVNSTTEKTAHMLANTGKVWFCIDKDM